MKQFIGVIILFFSINAMCEIIDKRSKGRLGVLREIRQRRVILPLYLSFQCTNSFSEIVNKCTQLKGEADRQKKWNIKSCMWDIERSEIIFDAEYAEDYELSSGKVISRSDILNVGETARMEALKYCKDRTPKSAEIEYFRKQWPILSKIPFMYGLLDPNDYPYILSLTISNERIFNPYKDKDIDIKKEKRSNAINR